MDHKILCRILITVLLLVLFHFLPLTGIIRLFLYLIPWLIIGYDILLEAAKHLLHRKVFDENFLMVLATVGAIVIGEYPEATAVMLFYRIGELLEDLAVGKSRKSIRELMDIRPDHANILNTEGKPIRVSPESVLPGTMILVSPGERIPLDGLIEEGASSLDTSTLTGESLPHEVCVGDQVISGCVNLSGLISVRVTKPFGESTASRIMDLAENAAERKSHAERFINRFAAVYTPVVCVLALLLFLIPTLLSGGAEWRSWLYRAMTLLVISCPCSLVISIPLTFFAGIGGAGRRGILVRSADTLEAVSDIRTILFDKTGTLTKGNFEVIGIRNATVPEKQLLELAACAECFSVHPISRSLVAAYGAEPDRTRVSDVREASGKGVSATVDGRNILTGNEQFLVEHGVDVPACTAIGTLVHIASDGHFLGTIVISDVLKPGIREAIRSLRDQGIRKMVMLTGDHASVADQVASALGIDEVHSRLLPDEKVAETEKQLRQMAPGEKLAFVGDGVNDMPVIALADIGIAMGALGSDAAIEAADLVLMDDDPGKIVHAIRISRKCLRIARENIIFSLAVKLICVVLVATGNAGMSAGIFADTGVMILSVLNAIRALSVRKI